MTENQETNILFTLLTEALKSLLDNTSQSENWLHLMTNGPIC